MSGICGVVDRRTASRERLDALVDSIRFRGPEGAHAWMRRACGLGHSRLRIGEAIPAVEPLTLEGDVWITADARIDGREALARSLAGKGRQVPASASDAALILHAYHAWGDECPAHLLGDFAFAIWDARRERLFCARDHFGTKPFFYAPIPGGVVFANTFATVRLHPGVDGRVDEETVADFLLFEHSRDPGATGLRGVKRLPPAHRLVLESGELRVTAYWHPPHEPAVVYRRNARDYVAGFREVLAQAVTDRVPAGGAAIAMSGGLDSPALGALAREALGGESSRLRAQTIVYDRLFPDDERRFAAIAARALGIEVDHHVGDDYGLYRDFAEIAPRLAEPMHEPFAALDLDVARAAAVRHRVVLTGWDGDSLLTESPRPYFHELVAGGKWARAAMLGLAYLARERRVPAAVGVRKDARPHPVPAWINPEFAARLRLRERLETPSLPAARTRPNALRSLDLLMRHARFFELSDPGFTRVPVEYRHPFLDLRVVDYCLSLPPYPWCSGKHVLRQAMAGTLPDPIVSRRKTPLAGFPHHALLQEGASAWIDSHRLSEAAAAYVIRGKIPSVCAGPSPVASWINLRPLSLDLWLRAHTESSFHHRESMHEFA